MSEVRHISARSLFAQIVEESQMKFRSSGATMMINGVPILRSEA
jgi:hypothetical protein